MSVRTDTHTHILPEMDDGCANVEQSLQLLHALAKDGVRCVFLTPHYRSDCESIDDFLRRRDESARRLKQELPPNFPMELRLGSETTLSETLLRAKDIDRLCISGTNILPLELNQNTQFSELTMERIFRLRYDHRVIPMLVHVERYHSLRRKERALVQLIDEGCLAQINLDSLLTGDRRRLIRWIRRGYIHAVGTDCHAPDYRPPAYQDGMDVLQKKCSKRTCTILETAARLHYAQDMENLYSL